MSIIAEVKALPTGKKDLRSFGVTVGGAFIALWAVLWTVDHFFDRAGNFPVLLGIGVILMVFGALAPAVLKPVYLAWMTLALALGFVMSRVVLTLFFFLVLTPVGLFFRLIGRDALHRKLDRGAASYWIEKEYPIADRTRFEKFF